MKKILFPLLVIVSVTACKSKEKKDPPHKIQEIAVDSFLITDSSWGLITSATDFEGLKKIYGEANLKDIRECDAECMDSIDVTKVYPGQKNEITIIWNDTAYHKQIGLIESFNEAPDWHSAEGIKMGSGLKDLLRVNGKKISFYGFGWDYGGTVDSYNGGKLDKSKIAYRLNLGGDSFAGDTAIYGDIGLDTDMPAVQKAMDKIRVWWLTLSFYKAEE